MQSALKCLAPAFNLLSRTYVAVFLPFIVSARSAQPLDSSKISLRGSRSLPLQLVAFTGLVWFIGEFGYGVKDSTFFRYRCVALAVVRSNAFSFLAGF